mmetsp:Transcript_4594/g.9220  ORF Transcript_4594/g.9220 Transcript_4594/m.9220 type:complete len:112 (+) Transcript_4594:2131-2466(+)
MDASPPGLLDGVVSQNKQTEGRDKCNASRLRRKPTTVWTVVCNLFSAVFFVWALSFPSAGTNKESKQNVFAKEGHGREIEGAKAAFLLLLTHLFIHLVQFTELKETEPTQA